MSNDDDDSQSPKQIITEKGTFSLGPVIGKGGYGTVYQGLYVEAGVFVAIKRVDLSAMPADQRDGLKSEIKLLKGLTHPNVVQYIESSSDGGSLNIVMEFIEGGSLLRILNKFGKLPESLVGIYMYQVLQGLAYLHNQGVIHRDIKAANLLTTKDGTIKIADFGIAATTSSVDNMEALGTPYWMAPEIIELSGVTTKADIWSVACTVIELLTGRPPYFDLEPMSALFRISQDDHPPLPEGTSHACTDWLLSAFKKDPIQRYSAKQLLNHKWIQEAKIAQEKSQLGDAERVISDVKTKHKSMLLKSLHQQLGSPPPQSQTQHLLTSDNGMPQISITLSTQNTQKQPLFQLEGVSTIDESDDFENDFDIGDLDLSKSMDSLLSSTQNNTLNTQMKSDATSSELSDLKSLLDAASCGNTGLEEFSGSSDQLSFSEDLLKEINLDKIQGKNDAGVNLELLIPEGGFSGFSMDDDEGKSEDTGSDYNSDVEWVNGSSDITSEDDEDRLLKENQGYFQECICKRYKDFQVEGLNDDDAIFSLSDMLSDINEYAAVKVRAFMQVGVAPVVDVLTIAISRTEMLQGMVLKVVNKIVEGSPDLMRLMASAGGVPQFEVFAKTATSIDILNDVITFYDELYTLQRPIFFGNNGVSIISYMLKSLVDKVEIALDCILGILKIILRSLRDEKSRTLFDISHSYLRENLPGTLALVTDAFTDQVHIDYEHVPEVFSLVSGIFFELSGTDNKVRERLCGKDALDCIVHLFSSAGRGALETRLSIAKTIENLAETADNVAALRREGVLKAMLEQITDSKIGVLTETDTRSRIYNTMQKAVKLDPTLNPELIKFGIVPLLCADVEIRPLDAIAVPFLILLLKNAKRRDAFSKCKFIDILIRLLGSEVYASSAMETIAWWIERDSMSIKSKITQAKVVSEFSASFIASPTWNTMLVAIMNISKKSKAFAQKLGTIRDFMNCIMARLASSTPENILKLIDMIDILYASASKKKEFATEYSLVYTINELKRTLATKVVVCRALEKLLEKIK